MDIDETLKYTVVDLETSVNNTIGSNKASPFCKTNDIVLGLFKVNDGDRFCLRFIDSHGGSTSVTKDVLDNTDLLVGHNIKFDLLHLRKNFPSIVEAWIKRGGRVWDTQIVEYLLSGQEKLYPSLDYCSMKYGGTIKDDKIKEYWNSGVKTEDIPFSELEDYLRADVDNTDLVFCKQVEIVERTNMYSLIFSQMEALLALVEMEHNGMEYDIHLAQMRWTALDRKIVTLEQKIYTIMRDVLPSKMKAELSASSPIQISQVLYGGDVKCITDDVVLNADGTPYVYKSGIKKGQVKIKKREYTEKIKGLLVSSIPTGLSTGKNGAYPTDDKTLKNISSSWPVTTASEFADLLLEHRSLSKENSTYYMGISQLMFEDGKVHPNFNQCSTRTGRLSSTNPNAQNIAGKGNV